MSAHKTTNTPNAAPLRMTHPTPNTLRSPAARVFVTYLAREAPQFPEPTSHDSVCSLVFHTVVYPSGLALMCFEQVETEREWDSYRFVDASGLKLSRAAGVALQQTNDGRVTLGAFDELL